MTASCRGLGGSLGLDCIKPHSLRKDTVYVVAVVAAAGMGVGMMGVRGLYCALRKVQPCPGVYHEYH